MQPKMYKPLMQVTLIGICLYFMAFQCNAQTEFTFAPTTSDFSVTFSAKPKIEDFQVTTLEGDTFEGVRAELRAADSFQRVEVVNMPKGYVRMEVSKDDALKRLAMYAEQNGIQAPDFRWEISPLGPKASMRGTKILDNNGVPTAVTYEAVAYYGDTTFFMVFVGGVSKSYPTTRVFRFLKSVKKNPNKQN